MYLLKILAHPEITYMQRSTGDKFKAMMLSLNLQSMRLSAGDSKITSDEEVSANNSSHQLITEYLVSKVVAVMSAFSCYFRFNSLLSWWNEIVQSKRQHRRVVSLHSNYRAKTACTVTSQLVLILLFFHFRSF